MVSKEELKNLVVGLVNLKVSSDDICEIGVTIRTKTTLISLVEAFDEKKEEVPVVKTPEVSAPESVPPKSVGELPPVVQPIAEPPKKERKKRAPKVAEAPVVADPVATPMVAPIESKTSAAPITPQKPTGIARIVKLIGFYCKGQNIEPADITVALIKEKAFDIIEGYDDATVQTAIDEFRKNNMK